MHNIEEITTINKVATRAGETNILMKYIKMYYDELKILDKEPDWSECINIQFVDKLLDDKDSLEAILNNFAGYCQYQNRIPLEMGKFNNVLFLKVKEV